MKDAPVDFFVSGGGARNETLVRCSPQISHSSRLQRRRPPTDAGLPAQAKEAVAFALLAYETWHRRPGNVPAATGAIASGDSGQYHLCVTVAVAACLYAAAAAGHSLLIGCGGKPIRNRRHGHRVQPDQPRSAHRHRRPIRALDLLIFDALVRRDEHFNVQPWLAKAGTSPTRSPISSICAAESASTMAARSPPKM